MTSMRVNGGGFWVSEWRENCRVMEFLQRPANHGLLGNGTARIVLRSDQLGTLRRNIQLSRETASNSQRATKSNEMPHCCDLLKSQGAVGDDYG